MKKEINGTGVAIVTPFCDNGNVDYPALEKLLTHLVNGQVDFIVALGTTSEAVTLTPDEKKQVLSFVKDKLSGKLPLVMGLGGNNTQEVLNQLVQQDFTGIDAILSVAPYYNKPNQRGLFAHFAAIAEASPVPVILYNVPGRTASNLHAETTLKLANSYKQIIAVKEASGDLVQVMEIIRNKPKGFSVLSGDDALTFPMITLGAEGVISVVANALPGEFSEMVRLARQNNIEAARNLHYQILPIIELLFADGNPAGIKAALEILHVLNNNLRLPMLPVEDSIYQRLSKLLIQDN